MAQEPRKGDESSPMPLYGSPPSGQDEPTTAPQRNPPTTIYGGPPITRRWTLRGILLVIVGALAALAAAIFGYKKITTPVYGGPPAPRPPAPGGEVPGPRGEAPAPHDEPSRDVHGGAPAAVYGGPPVRREPPPDTRK
jgi:hypothetical protein